MDSRFATEVEDRLIRYARIDTQSDESSPTSPSTSKQYDLLELLADELGDMGAHDVAVTSYGALLATIPSTVDQPRPTIGFLAHVDTSPGFNATGVKPIVHRNYDGEKITFPDDAELVLSPDDSSYLASKIGDDIITASGTTLLGADDKAGVAIIMAMARYLLDTRDVHHGPIRICFTPDEEIGRGVHERLPGDLQAEVAYTLDGAGLGEVVYETFSADRAVVRVQGVSIHPGQAKDTMVNALHLAAKIIDTLPHVTRTPETTSERQGFIHVHHIAGNSAEAEIQFILRDFEEDALEEHGALLKQVCDTIQAAEPRSHITCDITSQYRNMRYWLANDMRPVELAREACLAHGIEPFSTPTRGGTDGSRLTEMGVPTPNLFTGMQSIHGPLEWVSISDMAKAVHVCISLTRLWADPARMEVNS